MGLTVGPAVDVGVAVAVARGGIVLTSQSPCSTVGLPEQCFITKNLVFCANGRRRISSSSFTTNKENKLGILL